MLAGGLCCVYSVTLEVLLICRLPVSGPSSLKASVRTKVYMQQEVEEKKDEARRGH